MIGKKEEIATQGLPVGKKQTANLTFASLLIRNVIRDLNTLKHLIAIADHKVTFTGTILQIVDIIADCVSRLEAEGLCQISCRQNHRRNIQQVIGKVLELSRERNWSLTEACNSAF